MRKTFESTFGCWRALARKYETVTDHMYHGVPLRDSTSRGLILERLFRQKYTSLIGPTRDAPLELKQKVAPFDFIGIDNKKIEVKSSSVTTTDNGKTSTYYRLQFQNISFTSFDCLYLIGFFPDEILFWEWDDTEKYGLSGKKNHMIKATTPTSNTWHGLKDIPFGRLIDKIPVSDVDYLDVRTESQQLYKSTPFGTLKSKTLGTIFEEIGEAIFQDHFGQTQTCGHGDSYDFWAVEQQKRIEVKAASLCINSKINGKVYWGFHFEHIIQELFDELFLIFYYPDRMEFWLSRDQETYYSKNGKLSFAYKDGKLSRSPGIHVDTIYF